jgi:hypothetical protein
VRTSTVISVASILIGPVLVLILLVLVASVSIAAIALTASSTAILHSLNLADCRIKRTSAGSSNHGAR